MSRPSRRQALGGALALPSLFLPSPAPAQTGAESLTILITTEGPRGGEGVLREFENTHRSLIRKLVLMQEDPAWLATGLTEAVRSGRPGVDVVVTNAAGFALGAAQDIWRPLPSGPLAEIGRLMNPAGRILQPLTSDFGLVVGAGPGGPLLLHRGSVLPSPPRSAAELLDYARQNPGRFQYARPRESMLGQIFVQGLPYLLGDRDPTDPQSGWDRSWAYLRELGRHVGYYPSSGTAALEEFAEGGSDLIPSLLGMFLIGRSSGLLPADTACSIMTGMPVIPHGFILAVPRGLPETRGPAVEALARFLMTPQIQMWAFGRGLVPGTGELPANEVATVGEAVREAWTQAMTPELSALLAQREMAPPLAPFQLTYMLRGWDEQIGALYGETR